MKWGLPSYWYWITLLNTSRMNSMYLPPPVTTPLPLTPTSAGGVTWGSAGG